MPNYNVSNKSWADSDATGTATGGGSDFILLKDATSQSDDAFNNWGIYIVSGTGAGQSRRMIDYVQTGHGSGERYAQVDTAWDTDPDSSSVYDITEGTDQNNGLGLGIYGGVNGAFLTPEKVMTVVAADDLIDIQGGRDYIIEDASNSCILFVDVAGTEGAPIVWRGFTTTPGDGTFADVVFNAGTNSLTSGIAGNLSGWYHKFKSMRVTGGSGDGVDINGAAGDSVTFEGFRSDNNGGWGIQGDNNIRYIKGQIDNNTSGGIDVDTQCHIIANKIFGNSGKPIITVGTAHILFNLVYDCGNVDYISFAGPLNIVAYNTVDGEGAAASVGLYQTSATITNARNEIFGNVIFDCNEGLKGAVDQGESNYVDYNLFYSNTTDRTNFSAGDNDISGSSDPFTNSGADDYTLKSGSEALIAGLDAGSV